MASEKIARSSSKDLWAIDRHWGVKLKWVGVSV
jgi:hypothetical protein